MLRTVIALVCSPILVFCLCIDDHSFTLETSKNASKNISYRLPSDVWPINYNVSITPHIAKNVTEGNSTFDGVVEIKLKVKSPVPAIILHAEELTFKREKCTLKNLLGDVIDDFTVTFEKDRSFVYFTKLHNDEFPEGNYTLTVHYVGAISNTNSTGMFVKTYMNEKQEWVPYVATKLEPVYARSIFPCFDEPNYKATFDVTINHNKNYIALSNMPVKSVSYANSIATTTFQTSPPMSTYLFAFVVSGFHKMTRGAQNETVYTTSSNLPNGEFGLKIGQKAIKEFEKFTNISYEIGKMDHIGFPFTWNSAMENWGLITYGEDMLLNAEQKLSTAIIVAHEVSHQWFGNVATPKWWKDVWLSESITTYMSYYIGDMIEPTFEVMKRFIAEDLQTNLLLNSYTSSPAVVQEVDSPSEIKNAFRYDTIYGKGSSVMRMLHHVLTEPVYQKALQYYLKKTYHSNADSDDFYKIAQEVIDEENIKLQIKPMMESWLNSAGYPIVTVNRNYETNQIEIRQERFISDDQSEEKLTSDHRYHVPINYASKSKSDFNNTTADYWLTKESMTLDAEVKPEDWVILNKQVTGFYRVNYDEKNWNLIIDYLHSAERKNVHEYNRAQMMADLQVFTQKGIVDMKTLLRFLDHLKHETSCLAWYPALEVLDYLFLKFVNAPSYPVVQRYALRIMRQIIDAVRHEKYDNSDGFAKMCKSKVLEIACEFGDASCNKKYVHTDFSEWLKYTNFRNSSDLHEYDLCKNVRVLKPVQLDENALRDILEDIYNSSVKDTFISAFACSNDEKFLKNLFNVLYNQSSHDDLYIFFQLLLYPIKVKVDPILDFFISDFSTVQINESNRKQLGEIMRSVALSTATKTQQEKLKSSKFITIFSNEIEEGFLQVKGNVEWMEKHEQEVIDIILELESQ